MIVMFLLVIAAAIVGFIFGWVSCRSHYGYFEVTRQLMETDKALKSEIWGEE